MTTVIRAILLSVGLNLMSSVALAADGPAQAIEINIDQPALYKALLQFSQQSGLNLVFQESEKVGDLPAPRLSGTYTPQAALEKLLQDSGYTFEFIGPQAVAVRARSSESNQAKPSAAVSSGDVSNVRLAQAGQEQQSNAANDSASATSDSSNAALEEVVVTAQKRAQSISDVALSMTALGSEEIERKNLVGMADYLRTVPGVSHVDMGAGQNVTIIRGISADPQWEAFSAGSTVGAYFGEVPMSGLRGSGSPDIKLVDMERVEVLRGPQGTLYGSGSLSGTVRNIPAAPDLQRLSGEVKAGYSATGGEGGTNDSLQGVLNLPAIEGKLALRVVGYRFNNSGYIENIAGSDAEFSARAASWGAAELAVDQDDIGNDEYTGGRASVLWSPTDRFNVTLTHITQDIEQNGLPEEQLNTGKFQQRRFQFGGAVGGGGEFIGDETDVNNVVLEYDFGWATLLSSSSWIEQTWNRNIDVGDLIGGYPGPSLLKYNNEGFAEEIRLTSQLQGPLQFIAGFYYEDLEFQGSQDTYYGGDPALNPFGGLFLIHGADTYNLQQRAFFGELSYALTDKLTLTGGARKFSYDRNDVNVLAGEFFGGTTTVTTLSNDESDISYKMNLTFKPNNDTLLYAQWAQGFRLGRPQAPLPSVCDPDGDGIIDGTNVSNSNLNMDSDYLDNYELGGKFRLLENRLALHAAIYQIEWEGLPIAPATDCGFTFFVNAGKARSRGVELESAFNVTRALQLNFGASYVRAELAENAANLGVNGDRLPGSPEYNASVGLQYEFDIASNPAYVRGDYAYVGEFYNNLQEAGLAAGGYTQLNMRIGATVNNFDIGLFVNNLTDADELSWVGTGFVDTRAYRLRPRTIGLNVGYQF